MTHRFRLWLIKKLVGKRMLIMNAWIFSPGGFEFGPGSKADAVIGNRFDVVKGPSTLGRIQPLYDGR